MTLLAIYAFIKFWLPLATATSLCVKGFFYTRSVVRNAQDGISIWTNTLLDNHMAHIQKAAEDASDSLKSIAEANHDFAVAMREMREDFQESQAENIRVQGAILTGIEVLKDR
ncbi:MAG TPA: hypothetical protein VHV29_06910 [Terriglobales bacterium]|jgi:hypothetical protein|nr:hypothetical protein [Terriglobales bacterium]